MEAIAYFFLAAVSLFLLVSGLTLTVFILIDRRVRRLQGKIPTPPAPAPTRV